MGDKGIVASTAGLAILLNEGIGDTIRVSLTPEPGAGREREVEIAQQVLQSMGLRSFLPQVSACPGCGRTTSTFFQEMAREITDHIKDRMPAWRERYPGVEEMKVAVMGCVVNGPGESKHADIGISLPGTFEAPVAPGVRRRQARPDAPRRRIVAEFIELLEALRRPPVRRRGPRLSAPRRLVSFLRRFGARRDAAVPAAEAFSQRRCSRAGWRGRAVAVAMLLLGVGGRVAHERGGDGRSGSPRGSPSRARSWSRCSSSTAGGGCGQEVVLWQQARRERRWREETGGPSPIQHPAQAETWLGTHPRGSVPQVYRVTASTLARGPGRAGAGDRRLGARIGHGGRLEGMGDRGAAGRWSRSPWTWPRSGRRGRRSRTATSGASSRRGLAVAEALRRHHAGDGGWLEPLLSARARMRPRARCRSASTCGSR